MYKHVRLSARGVLPEQGLENLGQIVVVGGKNNSGKSTLLLAIQEGQQYLKADEIQIEPLAACIRYQNNTSWNGAIDLVRSTTRNQDLLLERDKNDFVRRIRNDFQGYLFMGSPGPTLHHEELQARVDEQLRVHKLVFIPPKRLLELNDTIQTSRSVEPDGQGLLNYLFYAANQFETSPERKVYEAVRSAFHDISDGYDFIITTGPNNDLRLSFRQDGGQWISATYCGLGLQDLLVLLFFVINPAYDILIVEEPESHLHPAMQRKLLRFCKDKENKQFFFSTHSSVFLDLTLVDTILYTEMTEHGIEVSNDTSRAAVLDSLGYSVTDNLVSDLIILVEGPKDKPIIEEFLEKLGIYSSYSIKVWPMGGDIMDQCDLTVFAEKYKIVALIDKDPGSKKVRDSFMRNCEELGIEVYQLQRRAIENYFTVDALRSVFKGQIPADITEIDPDTVLEEQIGMNVKKNNYKIAKAMDLRDIENTDLSIFFEMVGRKLQE